MARYIDADKLLKEFEVDTSKDVMDISDIVFGAVTSIIEKQLTADVVEVKRGYWIEDDGYQICSECGEEHHWDEYRATYCEDCGAKMNREKEA